MQLRCPSCGTTHRAWDWDWRSHGGWGRLFVELNDIFPGEAVPTPALMRVLREASELSWRYFYLH